MASSGSVDTCEKMLKLVKEDIDQQTGVEKIFVDENVFSLCWGDIHQWLNWKALDHHMLTCGLASDYTELWGIIKDGVKSYNDRTALFTLLKQNGDIGFHLMYICIKRENEKNKLGHKSAYNRLERCARERMSRPPSWVTDEKEISDASRIQPESILSQEETDKPREQEVHTQEEGPSQQQQSSLAELVASQALLCTEDFSGATAHRPVPAPTLSVSGSSVTERYDRTALSERCSDFGTGNPVFLVGEALFAPDVVGKLPKQLDPPPPNECILEIVKIMLRYQRVDVAPRLCDLQLKSAMECSSIDKLVQEVAMFLVSCLNSRARGLSCGVLLAGVSCQHESSAIISDLGLDLQFVPTEQQIVASARKTVKVKRDGSFQEVHSQLLTSITHMEVLTINEGENDTAVEHQVLLVIVKPGMDACKDLLFAYKPSSFGAGAEVFIRYQGRSRQLQESDIDQLQQKLTHDCNTRFR